MGAWGGVLAAVATVGAVSPISEPSREFPIELVERVERREWTEEVFVFPSPAKTAFPANDKVWAHLLVPKGGNGKRAAVLLLPVMAAPNIWIEERFMRALLRRGLVVLWIEMPFQFHRRPHPSQPSGQVFLARSPQRLAGNFRQAILDARRALAWLASRPEVDPGRVGLLGISLGALVGSVAYSLDTRARFAVFLLGGADFPSLAVNGSMTGPTISRIGVTEADLREVWAGLDPLDYARSNVGKRALLYNVRSDSIIPKDNALKLRQAFPNSRQVWLPLGHYTATLHLLWLPRAIAKEMAAAL